MDDVNPTLFPMDALDPLAKGPTKPLIPLIDPHQHLWNLDVISLNWMRPGTPLSRSFLVEEYLAEAANLGIVQTVYMEVDATTGSLQAEADYVLELIDKPENQMSGATLGGRPGTEGFAQWVRQFAGDPRVKGFRQVLHEATPRGRCLEPAFVRDVQQLANSGHNFELCLRPDDLEDAAQLARECPDTLLILDHCGNAPLPPEICSEPSPCTREMWLRGLNEAAKRPNLVCKISGIVAQARPGEWSTEHLAPIIDACREAFGPERVLWASDWPVCTRAATLTEWVAAAREISSSWPLEDQRKLFHRNAERIYRLDPVEANG